MDEKITLKAARVNTGLTQEEVAKIMGVRRETISAWEDNNKIIKLGSLKRLCDLYKKSIDDIFFDF